jgi:ribulose-phosphate 3-epimerase
MKVKISPSILSADFSNIGKVAEELEEAGADSIHLDVMDGHFVRNITFGPILVNAIRRHTKLPLQVHLMIERPDLYVEQFGDAGSDMLIVHVEATSCDIAKTIEEIKKNGMKAGISVNPDSDIRSVFQFLPDVDMLLVMSVNPGFGGQKFMSESLSKIKKAREYIESKGLKAKISVDGGIKIDNAGKVIKAGVDEIVAGSAITGAASMKKAIGELRNPV